MYVPIFHLNFFLKIQKNVPVVLRKDLTIPRRDRVELEMKENCPGVRNIGAVQRSTVMLGMMADSASARTRGREEGEGEGEQDIDLPIDINTTPRFLEETVSLGGGEDEMTVRKINVKPYLEETVSLGRGETERDREAGMIALTRDMRRFSVAAGETVRLVRKRGKRMDQEAVVKEGTPQNMAMDGRVSTQEENDQDDIGSTGARMVIVNPCAVMAKESSSTENQESVMKDAASTTGAQIVNVRPCTIKMDETVSLQTEMKEEAGNEG